MALSDLFKFYPHEKSLWAKLFYQKLAQSSISYKLDLMRALALSNSPVASQIGIIDHFDIGHVHFTPKRYMFCYVIKKDNG